MDLLDAAIIGAGPAGISAALTLKQRQKNFILFGLGRVSSKVNAAPMIENYLGLPHISGQALGEAFTRHMQAMNISVTQERVTGVYALGSEFGIQTAGKLYRAKTVILACGVSFGKNLPGERELLGKGVSYCATCDGALYREKQVIVVGEYPEAEEDVVFLAGLTEHILYFPSYSQVGALPESVKVCREKPRSIRKGERQLELVTDQAAYPADGIFLLRESVAAEQLVPGLHMEGAHAAVNLQMETNFPGCFACGDLAGKPYQYSKAAGQGTVAALSAVGYIARMEHEQKE